MNAWALKLNLMTDELKDKLPPTDSRLRKDVLLFESNDVKSSDLEKDRLEKIQAERISQGRRKQFFSTNDITDEKKSNLEIDLQDLYEPRFFDKVVIGIDNDGKKIYNYTPKGNKYWHDRAAGKFKEYVPDIFHENCN